MQPSNVAWSLYDAIVLYANAVSKTINRGEDFRNGRTVLKNIRGETSSGKFLITFKTIRKPRSRIYEGYRQMHQKITKF